MKASLLIFSFILFLITLPLFSESNIMVTGFWYPSGEMISYFSQDIDLNPYGWIGENWEDYGYDIYSFFPDQTNYEGDFEVDYQDTWEDFWAITDDVKPVAIISFGLGNGPWEIEYNARNLTNWYYDNEFPFLPTPNPPDNTVPVNYVRNSTLPVQNICDAVDQNTSVNAWVDWYGNPGAYLCEYIAYLGMWYQEMNSYGWSENPCLASGFIHVGSSVNINDAREATYETVRQTIYYLNTFTNVNGTVYAGGTDPTGTQLYFSGDSEYSTEIDDPSGTFSLPYVASGTYLVTAVLGRYYYLQTTLEIDQDNNYFELELQDWSNENEISYFTAPEEVFNEITGSPVEFAARFTQEELGAYADDLIGSISLLAPASSEECEITMKLYSSSQEAQQPQDVLLETVIDSFAVDTWIELKLDIPVTIEFDTDYWVGYRIVSPAGDLGWLDNGPMAQNKGAWLWINGSGWQLLSDYAEYDANLALGMTVYSPNFNLTDDNIIVDNDMLLLRNHPNPFNARTGISFNIPVSGQATLDIFNIKGQKVTTLIDEFYQAGKHLVIWNGTDQTDKEVASGIYFYRLQCGSYNAIQKMILVK
ncbi:MAG: T9SS type A sorting domain-containing protein [Candidatus Cloacimonetes bacterium]|nr:T9SS type A sorting domain-containing protein [Candidatus Cloacimonadota bacterium]